MSAHGRPGAVPVAAWQEAAPAPAPAAVRADPRARGWLAAYLLSVLAFSFVHAWPLLAAALAGALLAAGRARWQLARRAALAVLAFNLTLSAGYAAVALWQGDFSGAYLLRINLRVFLLVYLGFWFVSRVNLAAAVAGWPTLAFLLTLTGAQARAAGRIVRDFRLALASRTPGPARLGDRARHATAQTLVLLDKSVSNASETALAMRSRGCFDD